MDEAENWIEILDYAKSNGLSISTIRRRIKAKKIAAKKVGGKYFLFNNNSASQGKSGELKLLLENESLKKQVNRLKEEIAELKMLVNVYESKF